MVTRVNEGAEQEEEPAREPKKPAKQEEEPAREPEKPAKQEEEAAREPEKPAKAEKVAPGMAAFTARLKALAPRYGQALQAAAPPVAAELKGLFGQVNALVQKKDFAAAGAALDHLEVKVNGASNGAASQAARAPTQEGKAAQEAELKKRLKELLPRYLAAGKAAPDQKPTLDQISAQAMAAMKSRNFMAALAQLDQLEAAIKAAEKSSAALNAQAGAFKERLRALTPQYQAAGKTAPEQKPTLDKIVAQVMAAAKAQNYTAGLAHLDQLEAALKALQAPRAPDGAALFKERLKVLTPQYQAAAKATPEQKPTLDKILAQVAAAAKAQNYPAGLAQLDQLEAALKAIQTPRAPDSAALFKERLRALTPQYQAAAKAAPEQKATLNKILAQVAAAAKGRTTQLAWRSSTSWKPRSRPFRHHGHRRVPPSSRSASGADAAVPGRGEGGARAEGNA